MELGMFTSGYQYYPLERAFADARRFGYDYIELWGGRPHAFVQHELVAHAEHADAPAAFLHVCFPHSNHNPSVGRTTRL